MLLVVGLVAWAFAVSALGVGGSIKDSFFSWMPGWALDPFPAGAGQSDGTANVVTAVRRLPPLEAVGRRQPGLILAPMVHAVWRLKDVRIGIAVHITLNALALPNVLPRLLG